MGERATRFSGIGRRLLEVGVEDNEIKALAATVADELDRAVEAARRYANPAATTLADFVIRAETSTRGAATTR